MTDADFLQRTRDGYDRTATGYTAAFHDHLATKPVDLAMLAAFAGLVAKGADTRVADIGCGTGATTAMLRDHGVDAFGIDLSPNMIAEALRLNPDIDFTVGSMTELSLPDAAVGGICAWYSIIHVPDTHLPDVFAGFYRALAPGGVLLLAFQVGARPRILTEAFDTAVDLTFHRRRPEAVAALLQEAGLPLYAQLLREPDGGRVESTPQAYLIAQKPEENCP